MMMNTLQSDRPEWYAAQVWAGREHLSAKHLAVRGYTVFLPRYREYRRWSDRVKVHERALFAGYVFCCVSGNVVAKLVTTPGVLRIVGDGERPLPVPAGEIDALQRVVDAGLEAEPWEFLRVGQRVRIQAGPLRGTEGIFLRANDAHRLVLSISLLQRSVAVEIPPSWVDLTPGPVPQYTHQIDNA